MSRRGFTLFELLAVLVIIGFIAVFAIPVYRHHMLRVHRAEAMAALLQLQSAQEFHYQRNGVYTATVAITASKYALSVALAADGQSFVATATPMPVGGQAEDFECLAFSIDARGRRGVSGTGGAQRCWK
ncbi:MAG TPA: type IV pilin protein [Steroidobacteraceae bacterium]|nr:type IV pilin protein [Steroidobacteraceae bacterium]